MVSTETSSAQQNVVQSPSSQKIASTKTHSEPRKPIRRTRSVRCVNVVVVGNRSVGKSWFSHRFAQPNEELNKNVAATIAVNTIARDITLGGKELNVLIWDTAGSEQYRSVTPSYYRRADAVVLVYDITDLKSFEDLPSWYADVRKYAKENVKMIVVGHKLDLEPSRNISYQEGHRYAQENDCPFFEASAITGEGVEDAFKALLRKVLATQPGTPETPEPEGIRLTAQQPTPPSGGCWC